MHIHPEVHGLVKSIRSLSVYGFSLADESYSLFENLASFSCLSNGDRYIGLRRGISSLIHRCAGTLEFLWLEDENTICWVIAVLKTERANKYATKYTLLDFPSLREIVLHGQTFQYANIDTVQTVIMPFLSRVPRVALVYSKTCVVPSVARVMNGVFTRNPEDGTSNEMLRIENGRQFFVYASTRMLVINGGTYDPIDFSYYLDTLGGLKLIVFVYAHNHGFFPFGKQTHKALMNWSRLIPEGIRTVFVYTGKNTASPLQPSWTMTAEQFASKFPPEIADFALEHSGSTYEYDFGETPSERTGSDVRIYTHPEPKQTV